MIFSNKSHIKANKKLLEIANQVKMYNLGRIIKNRISSESKVKNCSFAVKVKQQNSFVL